MARAIGVRRLVLCKGWLQAALGVCLFVALLLLSGQPVRAAGFSGKFDGIGTAAGMTLTLQEADGRVVGRFDARRGDPFTLNGRRTGEAAQGSVTGAGQQYFFHVEPRPLGVQFLLIPTGPDGAPDVSGATDYSFIQQGLQVPQPSDFRPAPPRGIDVDIFDFIDTFREWSPRDMARIYLALDSRYQELIQLFDHAAAEILWRVCTTSPPNDVVSHVQLTRLLERQRTDCPSFLAQTARVRDAGLLNEFLRKANFQFELIRETVKCDRGLSPETKCADVGAMSSPLMMRWRRAEDIMLSLAPEKTEGEKAPALSPLPETHSVSEAEEVPVPLARQDDTPTLAAPVAEEAAGDIRLPRARPGTPVAEELPAYDGALPFPMARPARDG
ncbi:MAG: hypothetical protein RLO08_18995 [Parvibaculaceae bacterium]